MKAIKEFFYAWWILFLLLILAILTAYDKIFPINKKYTAMNLTRKWFVWMVVFAFLSVISFFQINSAWADEKNLNSVFTIAGVVFACITVFCLIKVAQYGGSGKE